MPSSQTKTADVEKVAESPLYSVVAFYGFDSSPLRLKWIYDFAVEWLRAYTGIPSFLGVEGPGFSGNYASFKRADLKLRRAGFREISAIAVTSSLEAGESLAINANMSVGASLDSQYVFFASALDVVPQMKMIRTAKSIVSKLCPNYGIWYTRERRMGPSLYAIGFNGFWEPVFCGPRYEERVRVTKWAEAMEERVYLQGILRDVYPYNFLTEPQLTRSVGPMPLQDWVDEDSSRGEISHFEGDVWLWSVPDERIPTIRDELRQHGIIFGLKPDKQ